MGGSVSMIDGHIDEVCPCIGCELRKYYVRVFDLHWHDGEDCPYGCREWDKWKERAGA